MIPYSKCLKLLDDGFSLITVSNDKIPNFSWKKYQTSQPKIKDFEKYYNYRGGIFKKNNEEIRPTENIGIVTGYNDLECLDVDLKVLATSKEMVEWWDEFLSFLDDNILNFKDKFAITKTKNDGYHILYKTKSVGGNRKIAKLKGQNEAILETRGKGGYIFVYNNFLDGKNYEDIDYISDEDKEILFSVAETYNYIEPKEDKIPTTKNTKENFAEGDLKPWEDFNNKNTVWDIVADDFSIVRNLSDKIIIKRNNAKSPHSGYIYKLENRMFLFSTGTIYDAQKQYSPFQAYTRKHFNDDFSKAAKKVYADGYGSRIVKVEFPEPIEIKKECLTFPLHIFPREIQNFIVTANQTLLNSVEYMGCALLWVISVSIGNALKIEVIPGWTEASTIWLALVGQPGWGKTPSINRILKPLLKKNAREVRRYYKELEKYDAYEALTNKEKKDYPSVEKPAKKQFIANDITLEALVDLHQESDNSVGVFKDELAGWFKDMNKYREGSDLEFWLSCWSGSPVNLTRVTRKASYIERPSIPILGGIQPSVLTNFNTVENKENGFMDRILLCFPDLKSEYLSKKRISYEQILWFNDIVVNFYDVIQNKILQRNFEGDIDPHICKMSAEAFALYDKQHRIITDQENDENVNQYLKSMLPKQKAYIARFALLIHAFNDSFTDNGNVLLISKESMQKAIDLSNYFIENAKKVKLDSIKVSEMKTIINNNKYKSNAEKFAAMYKANPNVCKKEAAEQLGVSIQMIYKYIKKLEK